MILFVFVIICIPYQFFLPFDRRLLIKPTVYFLSGGIDKRKILLNLPLITSQKRVLEVTSNKRLVCKRPCVSPKGAVTAKVAAANQP
jgi:hypothetical protein